MWNTNKKKNKHKHMDKEKKSFDERWEQFMIEAGAIDSDGNIVIH